MRGLRQAKDYGKSSPFRPKQQGEGLALEEQRASVAMRSEQARDGRRWSGAPGRARPGRSVRRPGSVSV